MATVASSRNVPEWRANWRAREAIARRALRDSRVRMITFAYLFAAVAYIQPVSYRHTYPTLADRLSFAHSFANNKAVVLFYGKAYDLLTIGGYSAWRVGGTLAIFAALFGLLAAVRALRTEEDAGRAELVLAGIAGRNSAYLAALGAIAAGTLVLWLAEFAGSLLGGLPAAGSAYLALATTCVVPVFVGVGALASQLAPTRRMALELGGALAAFSFVLRVIADTSSGLSWLWWTTPLGWAQELRPFTGIRPAVLLLPLAASVLLIVASTLISARRDVGSGVLSAHDSARPRLGLLSSATAQALRTERVSLGVWLSGVGVFAFIVGVISKSIS
jgi:ABC-2 type transport system permease protein